MLRLRDIRKDKEKSMKTKERESFWIQVKKDWKRNRSLYLMVLPVILFYVLFHYKPMYGALIAFQDYNPRLGFSGSEWVGFDQFNRFFTSPYFGRLVKNTLLLSVYGILFGFPAPIILALLLNELRAKRFKKTVQTITYLPHFISLVVVTGIIKDFTQSTGLINDIIVMFGGERSSLIQNPALYRTIYIVSDIWQGIGWGSIIYLSALSGVDQQLYEAASIDGASKLQQLFHISLPGIVSVISIQFLLTIGRILSIGYEKIILLYNGATYETADVISTYVYRRGLIEANYSYGAAVSIFQSVIALFLVVMANKAAKKVGQTSLW